MSLRERVIKPVAPLVYPDEYIVEEDNMGDSGAQEWLMHYLRDILHYFYRQEQWLIMLNRNHYHQAINNSEKLIVPDVAVFKGIAIPYEEQRLITSWDMRKGNKPPPSLVIEVSSGKTYSGDINPDRKPRLYGLVGVKEYFAYDPNEPPVWPKRIGKRLLGWRYDEQGQRQDIEPDVATGRLWSEVLECWLAEDTSYLRFYNPQGQLILTEKEAEAQARHQAEQQNANLRQQLEDLRRQLESR